VTLRIAWLTTGKGPGSFGALDHVFKAVDGGLPVEVATVFVNRDPGEAEPTDKLLAMAASHGCHLETLSSVAFRKSHGGTVSRPGESLQPWRIEYDEAVSEMLARHRFDLGVMFGYMLIATESLYGRFQFINDHPALPDGPIGTYQEVIAQLINEHARESGCMMNLVTGDVDRGPALSFCRFPIRDARNESLWVAHDFGASTKQLESSMLYLDIRRRGVERERPFLVETLRAIAAGELPVPPDSALNLTAKVAQALSGHRQDGQPSGSGVSSGHA
jgi:folate-dependent phosphoribosylglycinamide formyltransferase PurN